jgi:hypothetical protein
MPITIDDDLVAEIDAFMAGGATPTLGGDPRLARAGLSQSSFEATEEQDRDCVATLRYIYDRLHGGGRERPCAWP